MVNTRLRIIIQWQKSMRTNGKKNYSLEALNNKLQLKFYFDLVSRL